MNAEWALQQVEDLMEHLDLSYALWAGEGRTDRRVDDRIEALHPIYRQIRERATSEAAGYSVGGSSSDWSWHGLRSDALQIRELLRRSEELEQNLSPQVPCCLRHNCTRGSGGRLWTNGMPGFPERPCATPESVAAHLRSKLGSATGSGAQLATEAFTTNTPSLGQVAKRLRLPRFERSSEFWRSIHDGAMHFGRGCFMAIRNVATHEIDDAADDQVYLEQLAALSVFARLVDDAEAVDEAGPSSPGSG